MFTGLVEAVGEVVERQASSGGARLRIESPLAAELALGDSVAVTRLAIATFARSTGTLCL